MRSSCLRVLLVKHIFALLRVGKCIVTSYNITCTSRYILFQGLEVKSSTNQVKITIPLSKTQQTVWQTLIIQGQPHSPLCPVRSIIFFIECLKFRPTSPPSHIFLVHNDNVPITKFHFNAVLQQAL